MTNILVVDDMAICREPIVAALREKGYTVNAAKNGKEALQLIESFRPHLVLLDVSMPQMDGWEVLRILRRNPNHKELPVILLTATADRQSVLQAHELGISSYLVKEDFSLEELFNRVSAQIDRRVRGNTPSGRSIAAANSNSPKAAKALNVRLTREQTLERINKCSNAKTLPGCIAEVIATASSPRASRETLVTILTRDPVLCTRVLQLANSAAFSIGGSQVTNVDEAVRRIGLNAVRNLATSVGIFEAFPMAGGNATELVRCWQHSFGVAALMDRLVAESENTPCGLPQLVGLCHDLVEIVLRQEFSEEFNLAIHIAGGDLPVDRAIETILSVPQTELNQFVLGRLGLPDAIFSPIQELIRASGVEALAQSSLLKSPLARSLAFADLYANALQLASNVHAVIRPVLKSELEGIGFAKDVLLDGVGIRGSSIATTNLLAQVGSAEQAVLCRPLFERRDTAIWYARYATFSPLDPLGAALDLLAKPQIHNRLPTVQELSQCRGMVIATPRAGIDPFSPAQVEQLRRQAGLANFPVLMLAAVANDATSAQASARFATYPVSLSDLHDFIHSLDQTNVITDANAA